jgi:hypothetical protein
MVIVHNTFGSIHGGIVSDRELKGSKDDGKLNGTTLLSIVMKVEQFKFIEH